MRSTSAVESAMSHTTSVRNCGVAMWPGPGCISSWWISAVMMVPRGSGSSSFRGRAQRGNRNPVTFKIPAGYAAKSLGSGFRRNDDKLFVLSRYYESASGMTTTFSSFQMLRVNALNDELQTSAFAGAFLASTHHVRAVATRALHVVQRAIGFAVPHRPFVFVAAQAAADADGHGEFRRIFREAQLAHAFGDAQGA